MRRGREEEEKEGGRKEELKGKGKRKGRGEEKERGRGREGKRREGKERGRKREGESCLCVQPNTAPHPLEGSHGLELHPREQEQLQARSAAEVLTGLFTKSSTENNQQH